MYQGSCSSFTSFLDSSSVAARTLIDTNITPEGTVVSLPNLTAPMSLTHESFLELLGTEYQHAKGPDSSAFSECCFFLPSSNRCSDYHKAEMSSSSALLQILLLYLWQISHCTLIYLITRHSPYVFLVSLSSSTPLTKFLLFFQDIS